MRVTFRYLEVIPDFIYAAEPGLYNFLTIKYD